MQPLVPSDLFGQLIIIKQQANSWLKSHTDKLKSRYLRQRFKHYLILGSRSSGKSSLVQAALPDLNLLVANDPNQPEQLSAWFNGQILLTEIRYDQLPTKQLSASRWRQLMLHARRWQLSKTISGVIMCVEFQQLNNASTEQLSNTLTTALDHLAPYLKKNTPLLLVLTKADAILGFNEFFDDLSIEQYEQAWGLLFSPPPSATHWEDTFKQTFSNLLKPLQERCFLRLQQTKLLRHRELILEFPLQIESLQKTIFELLNKLRHNSPATLAGFYFTSAKQQGIAQDRLHKPLQRVFAIERAKTELQISIVQKAFFIRGLLTGVCPFINQYHSQQHYTAKLWLARSLYLIAGLLLVTGAWWWGSELAHKLTSLQQTQQAIAQSIIQLQKEKPTQLTELLPLLDQLQTASTKLNDSTELETKLLHLQAPSLNQTQQTNILYTNALHHKLLPMISQILTAELEKELSDPNQHPEYTFLALQAYIMLNNPKQFTKPVFSDWFQQYIDQTSELNETQKHSLLSHINTLLADPKLHVLVAQHSEKSQLAFLPTELQTQFAEMFNYLTDIAYADDPEQAAFVAVKERILANKPTPISNMLKLTKEIPPPLNRWLYEWAQNSWNSLLEHSKNHIEKQWANDVLPFYHKFIFNRYPIFSQATQDIDLAHFDELFAQQGLLDRFFNTYIVPFVNTSQAHWKQKLIDQSALGFSKETLQFFAHTQIIKKMFYQHSPHKAAVDFSLKLLSMNDKLANVHIDLDNYPLIDYPQMMKTHKFAWPSAADHAWIAFYPKQVDSSGIKVDEQGPWALFKLLKQADLQQQDDPRNYLLSFAEAGYEAKYLMRSPDIINAFIPGIIDSLRFPSHL